MTLQHVHHRRQQHADERHAGLDPLASINKSLRLFHRYFISDCLFFILLNVKRLHIRITHTSEHLEHEQVPHRLHLSARNRPRVHYQLHLFLRQIFDILILTFFELSLQSVIRAGTDQPEVVCTVQQSLQVLVVVVYRAVATIAFILALFHLSLHCIVQPGIPVVYGFNGYVSPRLQLPVFLQTFQQQPVVPAGAVADLQSVNLTLNPRQHSILLAVNLGARIHKLAHSRNVNRLSRLDILINFFVNTADDDAKPVVQRVGIRACNHSTCPVFAQNLHTCTYIIRLPVNRHAHVQRSQLIIAALLAPVPYNCYRKHIAQF